MDQHDKLTIRLNAEDNVVVSLSDTDPGMEDQNCKLKIRDHIPAGHKIATEKIAKGAFIRKYGQIIGAASRDIHPGEHVHTHNVEIGDFSLNYEIGKEVTPMRNRLVLTGLFATMVASQPAIISACFLLWDAPLRCVDISRIFSTVRYSVLIPMWTGLSG